MIVEELSCEDTEVGIPAVVGDNFDGENCLSGTDSSIFDIVNSEGVSVLGEDVEVFEGQMHELATIELTEDGQVFEYTVINPAAPEEITLNVYKLVCGGFSEDQEDGCVESHNLDSTEVDFTVTKTIGEDAEAVDTSLVVEGSEGLAVVNLPLVNSYTVCEDTPGGVEEVTFGILGVDRGGRLHHLRR